MTQRRFLLVEDQDVFAEILEDLLRTSFPGADIRRASSNDEASRLLETFVPDLVITDVMHPGPGGNGLHLLEDLRATPATEMTPVIISSASLSDVHGELVAYRLGATRVLIKPYPFETLIAAVNWALGIHSGPALTLIRFGREHRSLDYKESLDLADKVQRANLAKDVIAFANSGGGTIVVGMAEPEPGRFVPQGVPQESLATLETTRVNQALRPYLDPPVAVSVRRVEDGPCTFVVLQIPAAHGSPVLASREDARAGLFQGRVYARTDAAESAEVRTSAELRQLLTRLSAPPERPL